MIVLGMAGDCCEGAGSTFECGSWFVSMMMGVFAHGRAVAIPQRGIEGEPVTSWISLLVKSPPESGQVSLWPDHALLGKLADTCPKCR